MGQKTWQLVSGAALAAVLLVGSTGAVLARDADDAAKGSASPSKGSPSAASPSSVSASSANSKGTCSLSTLWKTGDQPVHRQKLAGVPNFGKLNDHVWRSGQPSTDGYKQLAQMGLKTVVNLRKEISADADPVPAGVKEVYIPITDEHAPTVEQAEQFMAVVSDPSSWPVLVHCQGGEGRAGVMSALVRYSLDGWDDKRIGQEISNFRSVHFLIKLPMAGGQRAFIHDWEAKHTAGDYQQKIVMAP